jgi:RNA polymerase sigma factor (sigma-70 family)
MPPSSAAFTSAPTGPEVETLFRQLVTQHRTRLYRFVIRHIGQPDDADDIAQQAFVEAARTIDRFRGESELSTWLYGIAMNLVRNYLNRAPHRLHRFEPEAALDTHYAAEGDPRDIVSMQQTLQRLSRLMAELPHEMREVLTLVAIDEMPYEEAAALLSVPVGTVRSRLSRARSMLKARLARDGIETSI